MKILVTGSSGMLGCDICKVFSASNQVIGIDIAKDEVSYHADILDPASVNEIFLKEKPDLVIHAAAFTDVDGCEKDPQKAHKVNTEGTRNIAEASSKINAPLIFISTDFVFSGDKDFPYKEDEETGPINVYGKTKWEAENLLNEYCKDYAIVRTGWLYGRGGKNFVDTIINKAKRDKVLKVVDDQRGSPTYTKDLAQALLGLVTSGDISGSSVYHVSNAGDSSWYEFAKEIVSLVKDARDVIVKPIKSSELGRAATRPKYSVLDTEKFEKYTGCRMRPWKEALREYIKERYA